MHNPKTKTLDLHTIEELEKVQVFSISQGHQHVGKYKHFTRMPGMDAQHWRALTPTVLFEVQGGDLSTDG